MNLYVFLYGKIKGDSVEPELKITDTSFMREMQ